MKQDILKKYLYYDNQSGNFYWIKSKNSKKWVVYAKHSNKHYNLGYYDDIIEAATVYQKIAEKYHKQFIKL